MDRETLVSSRKPTKITIGRLNISRPSFSNRIIARNELRLVYSIRLE